MNLLMKFAIVFAAIGLVLSVVFGFVGGNRVVPLIVTAVVCTLISGGLGVGTYKVLELRVPEFLDMLQGLSGADYYDEEGSDLSLDDGEEVDSYEMSEGDAEGAPDGEKQFGDHIVVDKIKIKNEPKLMAAAIRTMLSKDKED